MEKYNLKNKKILLYGAASRGAIVRKILEKKGYNVIGFIDKRASEIKEFCDLNVYSVQSLSGSITDKSSVAIYIDLKNVFEHDKVALELLKNGFNNLIFRAGRYLDGTGNKEEIELNYAYDKLVDEQNNEDIIISSVDEIRFPQIKDNCYVKDDENDSTKIIIKCPLTSVFSDWMSEETQWTDKSIYVLYPHEQLFRAMLGESGANTEFYLNMCRNAAKSKNVDITEKWEKSLLENRTGVFESMKKSIDYDFDFFVRNAIDANWNENGYYNIDSGKHRCTFFMAMNYDYIFLKVDKNTYYDNINQEKISEVYGMIKENELFKLNYPIEHPHFIDYPCDNYNYFFFLAKIITQCFAKKLFSENCFSMKNKKVFISFDDGGFLKRHFIRMGANVYACSGATSFERTINLLFNMPEYLEHEEDNVYDLSITDGNIDAVNVKTKMNILIQPEKKKSSEDYCCLGKTMKQGSVICVYTKES